MAAAALHRTRMCKYFKSRICYKGDDCVFAHSLAELRPTSKPPKYNNKGSASSGGRSAETASPPSASGLEQTKPAPRWEKEPKHASDRARAMWKNASQSTASSSLSTISSAQEKLSDQDEVVNLMTTPPPTTLPPLGAAAPQLRQPDFDLCRGIPCQYSLPAHSALVLGVPFTSEGWSLGMPPLTLEGFHRSLGDSYEL